MRAMCGVQLKNRKRSKNVMSMLGLHETIDQLTIAVVPTPGPQTSTGLWTNWYRATQEIFHYFRFNYYPSFKIYYCPFISWLHLGHLGAEFNPQISKNEYGTDIARKFPCKGENDQ